MKYRRQVRSSGGLLPASALGANRTLDSHTRATWWHLVPITDGLLCGGPAQVTGFSNREEETVNKTGLIPFALETTLKEVSSLHLSCKSHYPLASPMTTSVAPRGFDGVESSCQGRCWPPAAAAKCTSCLLSPQVSRPSSSSTCLPQPAVVCACVLAVVADSSASLES